MPSARPSRKLQSDEWQEYKHKPTIRQKHFPERRTTRSSRQPSYEPTSYQSTLTQAQFVSTPRTSFELEEDAYVTDEYEEDGDRASKRRKVTKSKKKSKAELRRQSTLTQMPWLAHPDENGDEGCQAAYDSDVLSDCVQETDLEEEVVVVEEAKLAKADQDEVETEEESETEEAEDQTEEDDDDFRNTNPAETQLHQPTQPHQLIRGYDPADQDWEGYADGMEAAPNIKQEITSQVVPSSQPPPPTPQPIFKTPQKPIKREIPSSQSPPSTPLTLSQLSYHRTPLKELNRNTVSIRDNTPSRRASLQQLEVDETENLEPAPNFSKFSHQLMTPADEEGHVRLLPEASPSPIKRPRFDNGPVFARPSRVSAMPSIIQDSQDVEESQLTASAYYTPTSSPIHAAAVVRSSQATTVDMTQPSARRSSPVMTRTHAPSSPAPLLNHIDDNRRSSETTQLSMPKPPPFPSSLLESQFPTTMSSQLPVAWEPLSDIQNSADIKTVSQLAGSLMWDTQGI